MQKSENILAVVNEWVKKADAEEYTELIRNILILKFFKEVKIERT